MSRSFIQRIKIQFIQLVHIKMTIVREQKKDL